MIRVLASLLLVLAAALPGTAFAQPPVAAADWAAYKQRFLDDSGRIIDDANGSISHSEGQGYGLLLAYLADARGDFERIWAFTRKELLLRDDNLAAWKWDASATPHVTDVNNATDGDILIAYALARAGEGWQDRPMLDAALEMIQAIGKDLIVEQGGRMLILPGASGFAAADRPDGPVVNLSYWVFEAFPVFARLDATAPWDRVAADGLALLERARIAPRNLPPDWLSLARRPQPARGFPVEFGYNAVRIPLYMVRAGIDGAMAREVGEAMLSDGVPATFDLGSGAVKDRLDDAGYAIIPALAACAADGTSLPPELTTFRPTLYYPSTLHLLALAHVAEKGGQCR